MATNAISSLAVYDSSESEEDQSEQTETQLHLKPLNKDLSTSLSTLSSAPEVTSKVGVDRLRF